MANRNKAPHGKAQTNQAAATNRFVLRVDIFDTWHAGSGRGRGQHLDAAVVRDAQGLPYLPGRHLRGLLRDATECVEIWKHAKKGFEARLFGANRKASDPPVAPGQLAISNAVIDGGTRKWLLSTPNAKAALFTTAFHTAMQDGVAKPQSLRGIELVVPVTLFAEVVATGVSREDWIAFRQAPCLVRAVGAWRTRGLGRARLVLEVGP